MLLAILLQGNEKKNATKLVKKNCRETEGITQRVRTIYQSETKGIAK